MGEREREREREMSEEGKMGNGGTAVGGERATWVVAEDFLQKGHFAELLCRLL